MFPSGTPSIIRTVATGGVPDSEIPPAQQATKTRRTTFLLLLLGILSGLSAIFTVTATTNYRGRIARHTGGVVSKETDVISFEEEKEDDLLYVGEDENCKIVTTVEEENKGHRDLRTNDDLTLGPCSYRYPVRSPPPGEKGFLGDIDFFFLRREHERREQCFLHCIDQQDDRVVQPDTTWLVEATTMGLTKVVQKLKSKYNLDPLKLPDFDDRPRLNAVLEAIRGGYTDIVKILTDSDNDMVIDDLGRTVADYVRMKGSPIRPKFAAEILAIHQEETSRQLLRNVQQQKATVAETKSTTTDGDSGWDKGSSAPKIDVDRCDIDVIDGAMSRETFYNDYFLPGRPFVLRGYVPEQETRAFDKSRWETTYRFHPRTKVTVGPTAYPNLTGQEHCKDKMRIEDIEQHKECQEQPGVPMVHARHPDEEDLQELFPRYNGDLYDRSSAWRVLEDFFAPVPGEYNLGWQVFFGGDDSGATLHWHDAAFNALYVGAKTWKITPPQHRGFTGMPARVAAERLDDSYTLQCTQHPGDLMYIPNYWGHLTLNHGFSIGAAVILPNHYQMTANAVSRRAKGTDATSLQQGPQQKILFVHINKTGGTSIIRMLARRCRNQYLYGDWDKELHHRSFHATATSLIDRYGRYEWDTAYSFAVVRHPLARQVSNFFFLLEKCSRKWNSVCIERDIPKLDPKSLTDEQKIEAFHTYTRKLYEKYPPGSEKHYLFGSFGHGNEEFKTFNATQTSWLVDEDDKIVVKDIFHLEELSNGMGELASAIPCLNGGQSNKEASRFLKDEETEMIHSNASPRYPDYKLFGKNAKTNRIMKEVYAVDFKNFGYKY